MRSPPWLNQTLGTSRDGGGLNRLGRLRDLLIKVKSFYDDDFPWLLTVVNVLTSATLLFLFSIYPTKVVMLQIVKLSPHGLDGSSSTRFVFCKSITVTDIMNQGKIVVPGDRIAELRDLEKAKLSMPGDRIAELRDLEKAKLRTLVYVRCVNPSCVDEGDDVMDDDMLAGSFDGDEGGVFSEAVKEILAFHKNKMDTGQGVMKIIVFFASLTTKTKIIDEPRDFGCSFTEEARTTLHDVVDVVAAVACRCSQKLDVSTR
ncbi:hypothetical protein RHSIM_Rhsim03G0050900 [Rhododendron simsii]|uniref:Uncharacterized protein n=1 Tax=Rhododendron simsii TaxID=118357 RepID=A0A834LQQ0_RHOSS|nr:hypothetical protein RHSIM_Rhsim03G0050900 [Rhododendron simsii]